MGRVARAPPSMAGTAESHGVAPVASTMGREAAAPPIRPRTKAIPRTWQRFRTAAMGSEAAAPPIMAQRGPRIWQGLHTGSMGSEATAPPIMPAPTMGREAEAPPTMRKMPGTPGEGALSPNPKDHEDLAGWWGQQSESSQGLQASRWRPVLEAPQPDRHQRKITEFFPSKPSPPSAPADSSQASGDESRGSGDPEAVTQQEQVPCSGAPPPGEPLDHRLDRCEPRRARSLDGSQVEPRLESGPLVPRPASYPPAWNRPGLGQTGTAGRQLEGGPQSVPQLAEQTVAHTATPSTAQGECLCDKQEPKACSAESEWWSARSEGSLGERQPQGPEPQLQRKGQEQGLTARSLSPEQEQAEDQTEEACSPECTRQEGECSEEERRSEGRAGGISPLPGSLSQGQWVHATQPVSEVSGEEPWPLLGGDVGRRLLGGRPRLGKSNGRHRRSRLQRDAGQVPPAIDRGRNGSPGDDPGSQGTVGGGGSEAPADICGVEAKTRCCNGTDAHTGNCWSNARGSPVAVARPHTETPATNPAGQSSGRPPDMDITARVQQLRELRNRLAGQGSDGSVVGTIDVMLGMLDDSNEQPC